MIALAVVFALYYAAAVGVAFALPYENAGYLWARLVAIVLSLGIIRFREAVVYALFNRVFLSSIWWVFVPLTLYFVIVFGMTVGIEYRQMLRHSI